MYTRSRQSQNFTGTPQRQQGANQGQPQFQQYKQHGNYQGGNQNNFNQGNNTPYKQPQQGQQQQQTPQPQRPILKPILKTSTTNVQGSPAQTQGQNQAYQQQQQQQPQQQQQNVEPVQEVNNGVDTKESIEGIMDQGEAQDIPKWRRKTPGLKVNRKLKRLRLNQRLRKTLQPKNAIMVLNEMKTGVQFTFPETQSALPNSLFLVHAEIDGKTYVGQGISKPLARQNAAENALKSLLLEKMTAAAMKARTDAENEPAAAAAAAVAAGAGGDVEEIKEGDETKMETTEDADEIPWSSLASFALYKLFLEWQNQGTVVPVPRPGVSPGKVKKETSKPVVQKELPANATTIHPVMLLNQMRPGLTYTEVSRIGNPPNTMFTLGLEIDGQEYTGSAKNKKDAKKLAAKNALHALYGLVYPDDGQVEDVNMA